MVVKSKKEYDDLMNFLDVVDLKIKLDDVINNMRKKLIVDYNLNDDEVLYVVDNIKEMIEKKQFGVCPMNKDKVINEDCGNCIIYDDGCDFIRGVDNK